MSELIITLRNKVDMVVDKTDSLLIRKTDKWGDVEQQVHVGFLTNQLIDQMIENLNRLRTFAK